MLLTNFSLLEYRRMLKRDAYEEGRVAGMAERIAMIRSKLTKGFAPEKIAAWMEMDLAYVEQVARLHEQYMQEDDISIARRLLEERREKQETKKLFHFNFKKDRFLKNHQKHNLKHCNIILKTGNLLLLLIKLCFFIDAKYDTLKRRKAMKLKELNIFMRTVRGMVKQKE